MVTAAAAAVAPAQASPSSRSSIDERLASSRSSIVSDSSSRSSIDAAVADAGAGEASAQSQPAVDYDDQGGLFKTAQDLLVCLAHLDAAELQLPAWSAGSCDDGGGTDDKVRSTEQHNSIGMLVVALSSLRQVCTS